MKYDSDNQRIHRIGSVIKKEVAQIVQNDINDPRIKDVVITEVEMSKDLKHARIFFIIFKHKNKNISFSIPQESGKLIVMSGSTQKYWKHGIKKTKKIKKPRINLTFRNIIDN